MLATKLLVLLALVASVKSIIGQRRSHQPNGSSRESTITLKSIESNASTSTIASTTSSWNCHPQWLSRPFKRKNGYWCSMIWTYGIGNQNQMPYDYSKMQCEGNGYVLSSLETEEEYKYWTELALKQSYNVTAFWVGAAFNNTQYYWNDGQAISTMTSQPETVSSTGQVAWFINRKIETTPGFGTLKVVNKSGAGPPVVNAIICGRPGRQFN